MSKATFPETAGIESVKPLDGGSFSASDIRNALSALFQGDMGALRPRAQTVPDMTIHVNPITLNSFFQQVWGTGNSPLSFGGGNTSVFTAPSANPRIDIAYLNSSGAIAVVTGAEAVSPSANWASLPKDGIPICLVYHRASETKIVNFEDKDANPNDGYIYMDVRPFLNLGGGASLADMQAAQDNIALLAFRLAVQGSLTVQKMEDGVVDEYEDETGIDTAASQNENYDSAADCYSPTDAQDLCAGGSPVSGGDENLTGDIVPDSNDKLALNMNGSGNSFVDSSPSPKTVTAYGNATQLAKKFNRTAGYFNGAGDYVIVPNHSDWNFGSSNFTIEFWFNPQQTGGYYILNRSTGTFYIINESSNYVRCLFNGGSIDINMSAGDTATVNRWYHYAIVRSGNNFYGFLDGVLKVTVTNSSPISSGTDPINIGGNTGTYFKGWMKELRISNVARYTANFTPSATPFTSDTNTKLLVHFDSAASAPLSSFGYKYSATNSDYFSIADHGDFDIGTGNFTLEGFIRFETISTQPALFSLGNGIGNAGGVDVSYYSGTLYVYMGGSAHTFAWTPVVNRWYHVVFQRTGSTLEAYFDGQKCPTTSSSSLNISVSNGARLGVLGDIGYGGMIGGWRQVRFSKIARYTTSFTPPEDDFTVDADTILYLKFNESNGATTIIDYSPNTKTVTANGNTRIKFIEDYRSGIFKDEGNTGHKPYAVSTAKVDFFAPFGDAVGYFDRNSTSYLLVPNGSDFDFGTGSFTWELYFRTPADINNAAYGTMMAKYLTPSQGWIWYMDMRDSYKNFDVYDYNNSGRRLITPLQNFAPNTWYHLAVTGDGSTLRAFVNGFLQGSAAYGGSGYNGGAITPSIGSYNNGSWSSGILGLMDNVRISKGVARYTANFNPTPNVGTNPKEGAFDDSASTWWGSVQTGGNVSGASYIGYNFGSPVTPKAFTIKQHANYIGSVKVQKSSDGSSWVDVQTVTISENNTKNAYNFNNSTAAQYWRLLANDNPSSGSWQVEEIEFMVGAKNDMTLISNGFTAEATPAEIRIVLFEEDVDSLELNTDLKAWVSRDGGTTWTQITIVDEGDYESNKRILAGSISVSGQPSGAAVKYKVTTHNNRNMKFHGASLGWKA